MNKCVLVHSGNRDGYQVAIALKEAGLLKYLVTDDFFIRKIKPTVLIPFVRISYLAFFYYIINRVIKKGNINRFKDRALSKSSLAYAKKAVDIDFVVSYSYYSNVLFAFFKGKKILFQLHPHPKSVRSIFNEEIKIHPESKLSLQQEHEFLLLPNEYEVLCNESSNADIIIVASTFTKNTLIENGIDAKKINIVPYGVNLKKFKERIDYKRNADCLKIIFVGSLNQRKGLSYLAASCKLLEDDGLNIHLTIVGRGITDELLVKKYELKNVHIRYNISLDDLVAAYSNNDVFVMPSLCEGFGQVILEAMATGLPVITTNNTSGPDLIEDGKEGFIVQVGDSYSIAQKLLYLYKNPDVNNRMGKAASKKAQTFTWGKFRTNFMSVLKDVDRL